MPEQEKKEDGVKTPSPESKKPESTDERGVDWKNVAMEHKRKLEELAGKHQELVKYVSENVQPKVSPDQEQQERKQQLIQLFVQDPEGFVAHIANQAVNGVRAETAATWLRSQEGFKPEYEQDLAGLMRKYQFGGSPRDRAEAAWKMFRADNQDKFRSKEPESREKEIKRHQSAGPGRLGPVEQTDRRKELLNKLAKARTDRERATVMGEIRDNPLQ